MGVLLKNNARSTLHSSIKTSDAQIRVSTGHGSRFPQPLQDGDWFPVTLQDASGNIEIMRATSRSGDLITVMRGSEGTLARAFTAGDAVELRATAAAFLNDGDSGETVTVSISNGSLG